MSLTRRAASTRDGVELHGWSIPFQDQEGRGFHDAGSIVIPADGRRGEHVGALALLHVFAARRGTCWPSIGAGSERAGRGDRHHRSGRTRPRAARLALSAGAVEPAAAAKKVKTPVLIVVGEDDRVTPPAMARAVLDSLAGPKEFWVAPKAGHAVTSGGQIQLGSPDDSQRRSYKSLQTSQLQTWIGAWISWWTPLAATGQERGRCSQRRPDASSHLGGGRGPAAKGNRRTPDGRVVERDRDDFPSVQGSRPPEGRPVEVTNRRRLGATMKECATAARIQGKAGRAGRHLLLPRSAPRPMRGTGIRRRGDTSTSTTSSLRRQAIGRVRTPGACYRESQETSQEARGFQRRGEGVLGC